MLLAEGILTNYGAAVMISLGDKDSRNFYKAKQGSCLICL
jgi:hypothetical protein